MSNGSPLASRERPSFSIPSILSGIAALLIFLTDGYDVLLAVLAVVLGVIGSLLALLPSVRGGIVSIVSVIVGIIAVVVSILQMIF